MAVGAAAAAAAAARPVAVASGYRLPRRGLAGFAARRSTPRRPAPVVVVRAERDTRFDSMFPETAAMDRLARDLFSAPDFPEGGLPLAAAPRASPLAPSLAPSYHAESSQHTSGRTGDGGSYQSYSYSSVTIYGDRPSMGGAAGPTSLLPSGLVSLLALLLLAGAYVAAAVRFLKGLAATKFAASQGPKLALMWPVLALTSADFRREMLKVGTPGLGFQSHAA